MNDVKTTQIVSVVSKVTAVEQPTEITTKNGKTLTKQEVHTADATGSTVLVLWEDDVSCLELDRQIIHLN